MPTVEMSALIRASLALKTRTLARGDGVAGIAR